jgi:hypothetical protein
VNRRDQFSQAVARRDIGPAMAPVDVEFVRKPLRLDHSEALEAVGLRE